MPDEPYVITKADVAAIKEAEYVVVFWNKRGDEGPVSGIRIGRDVKLDRDGATVKVATIARQGLWETRGVTDYQIDYKRTIEAGIPPQVAMYGGETADYASWLGMNLRSYDSVRTVLSLLRVGDIIGVYFVGSNNNENNRDIGWVRDECYLRILRGRKTMEFLMDVHVGPNNTARLVKPR